MASLEQLEQELAGNDDILREVQEIIDVSQDPDALQDAINMRDAVEAQRREIVSKIAALQKSDVVSSPPPPPPPTVAATAIADASAGVDTASHGAAGSTSTAREDRRVFKVGETVSAKYAADRQFYPATIVSVMGSAAAPIYTVTFKGYVGTETVRAHEIRSVTTPSAASHKRKADGPAAVPSPAPSSQVPTPSNNGSVLSAPASINTDLAEALKRDSNTSTDEASKPKRAKKVKNKGALEKSQANWQSFQQKAGSGSGKMAKMVNKTSMFKTGEKPGSKVGFTGSGQAMRKDADRSRHTYYMPPEDSSRH